MRKIVLFVFLLGALCANAVDVTSYYKPAQYQEARYQEAQYEASYNAARYNEAVSDMSWSNSMLGRKITITNDKGVTNRDFGTVGALAPAFKTASGQTPRILGGGVSGNAGGLAGGSRGANNVTFSQQANSTVVLQNIPQVQAFLSSGTGTYTCNKCHQTTTVSYVIDKTWEGDHAVYTVTYSIGDNVIEEGSSESGWFAQLLSWIGIISNRDNIVKKTAQDQAKKLAKEYHKCPDPTAPLGDALIPLLLMLLCYALFRLVRGDVREEQEMA